MGKFMNKFKNQGSKAITTGKKFARGVDNQIQRQANKKKRWRSGKLHDKENTYFDDLSDDDFLDDFQDEQYNPYIDNIQPAQKPASFHHFILANQYQDLEKSIRGYKDVYNKDKQEWEIKRKQSHCFTDEEAEEILRTAQSHLATDIKLTFYSKETFGLRFLAVYEKLEFLFKRIMEYRYGRYGGEKEQGKMKDQALKIFVELITRIEANYLRALQGMENKLTHDSVKSQESLQAGNEDFEINRRYT